LENEGNSGNKTALTKILWVDDDKSVQPLVEVAFNKYPPAPEIKYFTSAKMALKLASKIKPDLILLDVMMPEMNGIDAIKKFKEIPEMKDTPVIFLTAKDKDYEIKSLLALGAVGVISKPINITKFALQVQEIWSKSEKEVT